MRALALRLLERVLDGPQCPACPHDQKVHGQYGCLAEVYDDRGKHDDWCSCKRTYGRAVAA
jgi:hypothetical protein